MWWRDLPWWQEMPLLLVVAFGIAVLVRTFLFQAYYIPSTSMVPELQVSDRVLVNRLSYAFGGQPVRGEVVVFRGPAAWAPEIVDTGSPGLFGRIGRNVGDLVGLGTLNEKDFVKRIVGLPGDVVACCDAEGRVTVNGYPLDEPYVTENTPIGVSTRPCADRRFDPVVVRPGEVFVLGDHRIGSQDSRCQGAVPIGNLIGRAFVIVWPAGRWESVPVPKTFEKVPAPTS